MVPTTVIIICGLIGVIVVLGFAIASGAGNGTLERIISKKESCSTDGVNRPVPYSAVSAKSSYKLSTLLVAGPCPVGYTTFTDLNGSALCCASSNIDIYSRTCAATGSESICAMSPGIPDSRDPDGAPHYPECKLIAKQQAQAQSGKLCPRAFPNYATMSGSGYKCCAGPLAAGGTDCLAGTSCTGLSSGQNLFNTPSSCEKALLMEKTQCPAGTAMVPEMRGSTSRTRNLSIPLCVGVNGNCLARGVLDSLRSVGYLTDINPDKNIINCDVYNKVFNDRLLDLSQVETSRSADL
uniref:Uncharacterized protein n=1 Tax=viral metagenome TaxID=1070528 RepID=A0A6C0DRW0_9ZZZZ